MPTGSGADGSRPRHAALVAAAVAMTMVAGLADEAAAKLPGKTHCYFGVCHRVKTLAETERLVGTRTTVQASFYDDCKVDRFNPCALTSSGEVFKPHRPDNAASPIYPDGTRLLLWHPKTRAAAVVRVNSAGPYHGRRTLDVSRATAERLGFKRSGVAQLHVQVLSAPTVAESRYKKHRTYPAVPGPIGQFDSFELAAADSLRRLQFLPPGHMLAESKPTVPARIAVSELPISNAKAINAAGRSATMAVMASIAGMAAPTTAHSASAMFMNSIPHNLLPPGVLTDVPVARKGNGRTARALIASTQRP